MELLIEAALWVCAIAGVFAALGLAAEGAEWFADEFDRWAESISTHYADD